MRALNGKTGDAMDASRFDTLIKSMTTDRIMRRGMMSSVVAMVMALLAAPTTPETDARKHTNTKRRKRRKKANQRENERDHAQRRRVQPEKNKKEAQEKEEGPQLQLIKAEGCQAGLAFNPATPLDVLQWVIDKVDLDPGS